LFLEILHTLSTPRCRLLLLLLLLLLSILCAG
jgi:hypothetical protein